MFTHTRGFGVHILIYPYHRLFWQWYYCIHFIDEEIEV